MGLRLFVIGAGAAGLLLLSAAEVRGGWASYGSDHSQLEGFVISAVGNVSQESWQNPRTRQTVEWYEFGNGFAAEHCFTMGGWAGYWGFGDRPALLLVNDRRQVWVAFFETVVGSIKVELRLVQPIECPSLQ